MAQRVQGSRQATQLIGAPTGPDWRCWRCACRNFSPVVQSANRLAFDYDHGRTMGVPKLCVVSETRIRIPIYTES